MSEADQRRFYELDAKALEQLVRGMAEEELSPPSPSLPAVIPTMPRARE